jgi:hypothetical protein
LAVARAFPQKTSHRDVYPETVRALNIPSPGARMYINKIYVSQVAFAHSLAAAMSKREHNSAFLWRRRLGTGRLSDQAQPKPEGHDAHNDERHQARRQK